MEKIKVLQVIPDLGTGGAEKVVLTYSKKLHYDSDIIMKTVVLGKDQGRVFEKNVSKDKLDFVFLNQQITD